MSTRVESGNDTLIKGKSHKNDVSPVRVSRTFTSHGNKQSLANVESMIDHRGSNILTWIGGFHNEMFQAHERLCSTFLFRTGRVWRIIDRANFTRRTSKRLCAPGRSTAWNWCYCCTHRFRDTTILCRHCVVTGDEHRTNPQLLQAYNHLFRFRPQGVFQHEHSHNTAVQCSHDDGASPGSEIARSDLNLLIEGDPLFL